MPERHNKFVRAENIKGFQRRLGAETDPEKRALIAKLLAEEEAMMRPHPKNISTIALTRTHPEEHPLNSPFS